MANRCWLVIEQLYREGMTLGLDRGRPSRADLYFDQKQFRRAVRQRGLEMKLERFL